MIKNIFKSCVVSLIFLPTMAFCVTFKALSFHALPGWSVGQQNKSLSALKRSCQFQLNRQAPSVLGRSKSGRRACLAALKLSSSVTPAIARRYFEQYYTPYAVLPDQPGLFTGYYEPTVPGSLTRTRRYGVPIYGVPKQLKRVKVGGKYKYRMLVNGRYVMPPSREQISKGPLLKNTPVLAWVHSKVDRSYIQIQGSGSIVLDNGQSILLGYAAQNGHPYYPIGRYLVKSGALKADKVSMQSIRAWLNAHPAFQERVLNSDASFVFFRRLAGQQPYGAQGVPLTPGISLAVDRRFIRLGSPIWLVTQLPQVPQLADGGKDFRSLMIAQDTGGAIKGAVRGDVFWGEGRRAELLAGAMQSKGRYWVLIPKGLSANVYARR